MKMPSRYELRSRAALCTQLAKREPANRIFWMAEAENWSRLSDQSFAASRSELHGAGSNAMIASKADRNPLPITAALKAASLSRTA